MAREKRKRSETGIYHIMVRGIDGCKIFIEDEDKDKFIESIIKSKEKGHFSLYGYCLMDNHVHVLVREGEEIGTSMKRITVSYVQWHNKKYGREGQLFQNRYKSEVVEDEAYLLTVLRYIHQNPIKAKITKTNKEYKWSSYNDYIDGFNGKKVEIDIDIVKGYFPNQSTFEEYMNEPNNDQCLEYIEKKNYTDKQLINEIKRNYNIEKIGQMTIDERNRMISDIKENTGASIRQLSKVLGIGRGVIERAVKL